MHAKSNFKYTIPSNPNFKPPQTKAEFEKLDYRARAQLQEKYPDIYNRFTAPR